ncbi:MAG: hypothetical protein QOG34_1483 [Frankiaceae bacterium]|jgi:hypothetical protein|nr:hypothetical protein [Frankiaceae bacterium]
MSGRVLRGAAVLAFFVAVVSGCGGSSERHVSGPSRVEVVAKIQAALPDIQPAPPSDGVAFDKLLKACIAVGNVNAQVQPATSPSLSDQERANLQTAAGVCTTDPNRAHTLLEAIAK